MSIFGKRQPRSTLSEDQTDNGKSDPTKLAFDATDAELRRAFGYAPDDERVTIRRVTGDIRDLDKIMNGLLNDFMGDAPDEKTAPDAGAPTENVTATETLRAAKAFERACEDEALGIGDPRPESAIERVIRQQEAAVSILMEVTTELVHAIAKHGPMNSPHEGISVIREEFEELWDHVKADTGRTAEAREEALQIAAMAIRYVIDLDPH